MTKYKDIANRIDKDELIDYYKTHLPKDVMNGEVNLQLIINIQRLLKLGQ